MKIILEERMEWGERVERVPVTVVGEEAWLLRPEWGFGEVCGILGKRFALRVMAEDSGDSTVWDTFDWRIWRTGGVLLGSVGRWELLSRDGAWTSEAERAGGVGGLKTGDFAAGEMREILAPVLGIRAVMPRLAVRWSRQVVEVLDELRKTVCRVELVEWRWDHGPTENAVRVAAVRPLRGYDAEAEEVREALRVGPVEGAPVDPLAEVLERAGCAPTEFSVRVQVGMAVKTPARVALGAVAGELLRLARTCEAGMRSDVDTEFLHDFRVCLRKARSVVALVKGVYPDETAARVKELLGGIARRTNRLRDCDVYLLERENFETLLPDELRPGLVRLFGDLERERAGVQRAVVEYLQGTDYAGSVAELEWVFAEPAALAESAESASPIGPVVARAVLRRYRKVRRLARDLDEDTPDEAIHRLRIHCKKLRYLVDFTEEIMPPEVIGRIETALRRLQNRLGAFNDYSVQRVALLEYFARTPQRGEASELALAIGGLVAVLYERQGRERKKIRKGLRRLCGREMRTLINEAFSDMAEGGRGEASPTDDSADIPAKTEAK